MLTGKETAGLFARKSLFGVVQRGLFHAVEHQGLVWLQVQMLLYRSVFIVERQAAEVGQVDRTVLLGFPAVKVVDHDQRFAGSTAGVGEYRRMPAVKRCKVAVGGHIILLTERDQLLVVGDEHRIGIVYLAGSIDRRMVGIHFDPRHGGGEAAGFAAIPLHRRAAVIARLYAEDIIGAVLMQSTAAQDVEMVDAFHVAVLVERGKAQGGSCRSPRPDRYRACRADSG